MPSATKTSSRKQSGVPNAKYTELDDAIIVRVMLEHRGTFQTDSGFRPPIWGHVLTALQGGGSNVGGPKTASKLKGYFGDTLKKHFLQVQALRELSGIGWDDVEKMVTASDEVWAALLADPGHRKKYKRWQNKPFPQYDGMATLVSGISATGSDAVVGGASQDVTADEASQAPEDGSQDDESQKLADASDEDSDEESQVTTTKPAHAAATPASRGVKRRHGSGRENRGTPQSRSVDRVASALSDMTDAMRSNDNSTPKRRRTAVKLFNEDGDLSADEAAEVYVLFSKDVAIADVYTSIEDKSHRTRFLRRMLQ